MKIGTTTKEKLLVTGLDLATIVLPWPLGNFFGLAIGTSLMISGREVCDRNDKTDLDEKVIKMRNKYWGKDKLISSLVSLPLPFLVGPIATKFTKFLGQRAGMIIASNGGKICSTSSLIIETGKTISIAQKYLGNEVINLLSEGKEVFSQITSFLGEKCLADESFYFNSFELMLQLLINQSSQMDDEELDTFITEIDKFNVKNYAMYVKEQGFQSSHIYRYFNYKINTLKSIYLK